ncbi:hypothetical protein TSUD_234300 [Trifolium subterraneum]|uniref:Uncharacterized protein n=1 Tax=Trifolium subterraneum TaxID=3900 RepID=A0A2Z6LWM5_TRISU|nr:hypothetical protein TSUD_234300 [Trifolium subterraneum]
MMMSQSHNSRRMLPPGNTRKRKQTEADKPDKQPIPSNKLLAGYLAHEFLTKGTLFGQIFDPTIDRADSESDSIIGSAADSTAEQMSSQCSADEEPTCSSVRKEHDSYSEVASIMKTNGIHIKGIVNPTQLSRWIHHHHHWFIV